MREFIVIVQPPVPNVKTYRIEAVDGTDAMHRLEKLLQEEGRSRLIGPRSVVTVIAPENVTDVCA